VKLKLDRRTLIVIAVIAVVAAALLFRGSGQGEQAPAAGPLDAGATQACDDFAAGYPGAKSRTARLGLADKIMQSTGDTENEAIRQRATELGRGANDGDKEWKTRADALTDACEAAGWGK
jgi:hypothetical protein